MATDLMAKGIKLSKSFHGHGVASGIPEAVTLKVLI
jgi:hypothetical protein